MLPKIALLLSLLTSRVQSLPMSNVTLTNLCSKFQSEYRDNGICDGAGAVLLASEAAASKNNMKPLARVVGWSVVGVDPTIMGIGPAPAIKKLLKATGKTLNDIDLIEINEAFAAQTLACAKDLDLDVNKLNVDGGAIALGHPLGASGSRIISHLIYELRRREAKLGIGSACIGGGQGIAVMIESL